MFIIEQNIANILVKIEKKTYQTISYDYNFFRP